MRDEDRIDRDLQRKIERGIRLLRRSIAGLRHLGVLSQLAPRLRQGRKSRQAFNPGGAGPGPGNCNTKYGAG